LNNSVYEFDVDVSISDAKKSHSAHSNDYKIRVNVIKTVNCGFPVAVSFASLGRISKERKRQQKRRGVKDGHDQPPYPTAGSGNGMHVRWNGPAKPDACSSPERSCSPG
jgi:hypothetical protein